MDLDMVAAFVVILAGLAGALALFGGLYVLVQIAKNFSR